MSWFYNAEIVLGEPGFFYLEFAYLYDGNVYGQRMDLNGNTYWPIWPTAPGALMIQRTGWWWASDLHFAYKFPYFVGVSDMNNYPGFVDLLVVQKLDASGNQVFGNSGVVLSVDDLQYSHFNDINIAPDEEDGIVAVSMLGHPTSLNQDIYAKRCHADGTLGGPFPLDVNLTPHNFPIQIPPGGGRFSYDLAIADTTPVGGVD